ncbi:unnamed protein product [Adineta steineri]|uniref:Uncharacterized protein n=1 Tax=Adineta steineri TaxID=433720 RepID=A0A819RR87_9BILA|nr:unnamed protein product [Adineta steineri]CAF1450475.1 unnamed protein product [Adineta steineri]CAF4018457.1 unnamed protein product [Adineta steineri]CAF4046306.1 unnamed protein product [Adineta steineri]
MENQISPYTIEPRRSDYPLLSQNLTDPRISQTMGQRSSNWNTGTFLNQNPQLSISQIDPQQFYPSPKPQMVRSNGWEPALTSNNNNKTNLSPDSNSRFSFSKLCAKLTSTKMLFFMVGFILCAVPLAVMTTLWLNARSSSTATTTVASVTVSNTSVSLPIQCYSYSTLSDIYRNYIYSYSCCPSSYDTISYMSAGWFRITGSAGTQLLANPISTTSTCGSSYPGYFNGTLPTTAGSMTTGNVCFYTGVSCGYSLSPISVINCNGYYVFYLIPTSSTSYRYCTSN